MLSAGDLRVFAKDFIRKTTRIKKVDAEDIRFLKSGNGIFPRKHVWADSTTHTGEFKELPYSAQDTFILFDVLEDKNSCSEIIDNRVKSMLSFRIIVNIYGNDCQSEAQFMIASLHQYALRLWLAGNKIALVKEPDEIQNADGRENASWWFRRRLEFVFNGEQSTDYDENLGSDEVIEGIGFNMEVERG